MSRAAILPFPGDPFLLNYWLHLYDRFWKNEVNTVYVYFNSTIEQGVVEYIKKICSRYPKVMLIYNPLQIDHGLGIDETLKVVSEDYVMLIEDDGFIFKSGKVDECFTLLENGTVDIIGSRRGSCHMEILTRAKEIWGLDYEGLGDQGPNFWPNFFFIKKSLLLSTDRNFCGKAWKRGEVIKALGDYVVKDEIIYSDTFVNTSLQLRAMVPQSRIMTIFQYHGHPDDLQHYENRTPYTLFDGSAFWCHIGSLSSGVGGILTDEFGRPLTRRLLDPKKENDTLPKYCNTDAEKREFERRVQWWQKFGIFWNENETDKSGDIANFWFAYMRAVDRVIVQYGLNRKNIARRQEVYKTLGLL